MARIIDGKEMNMVGANIKRIRQENGWSQQQLSDKTKNQSSRRSFPMTEEVREIFLQAKSAEEENQRLL